MPDPELRLVPSPGPADVDDLMRQAARGDSHAFEMLYDELSTHRGCSSHEATELFNELDELDAQYQSA